MAVFLEDAIKILHRRYLLKSSDGAVIESPEEMLRRVANTTAGPEVEREYWEEKFYRLMSAKRFLPNSPTLANAGRPKGQLAACFVLPIPDSIEGIFETMKKAALIHKTGGGTGFSFSNIRPKDDVVSSTGGIASGPVPFIGAYNSATDAVKQGGMRRGANMAVLDYWHPDILEFITCKKNEGILANFNISVGVDDRFMSEVVCNGEVVFVNPRTNQPTGKKIKAGEILTAMVQAAWENGEPGILYFDHINAANTVPGYGNLRATNPCGEQPLFDYESCNLGSLNLPAYITSSVDGRKKAINWDSLSEDILTAVRFLDNVIDVNHYLFPEVEAVSKGNRKIGLGVMGFADLLIELGIPYASEETLKLIDFLMAFIKKKALEASVLLGQEKGSFLNIDKSIFKGDSMRNATLTTIAPTGTLSMLFDISSGIEPLFGLSFVKEALNGTRFQITNNKFMEVAQKRGFWSQGLADEIALRGSLTGINGIPEDVREVFATAFEVKPEWHVKVQAAFQKHVDNAVSKTINFPSTVTPEEIRAIYIQAWKQKCKGLTVYRQGSRENQVLKFMAKDRCEDVQPGGCINCT